MAEESVIIPVKMELEESDLQSLKSSIEKTFEDIKKYSEIQGTKKEPYAVQGIKELSDEASNATAKIVDLQAQFKAIEQSTPFDGLKNTQKQIRDIITDQKDDVASINSLWSRYGNISKEIKRNEEEKKNVIQQQTKAQRDYKAEIDRVNKAYAKPAKVSDDPQKQAQAEIEAENKRRKALADVERYYKNINKELKSQEFSVTKTGERLNNELDKVKSELATRRESLANSEASLKALRAQASEEGRLLKNAEYLKVKEQERLVRLDAINKKLLEQEEIISNAQYKAEKNLAEDKSATGYKPIEQRKRDSEAARKLKADERELAKAIREAAQEDRNRVQAYNEEARVRNALHKEEMGRIKEEERAKKAQAKEAIRDLNGQIAAEKKIASQYYYRLRSVKMLGFAMNNVANTVNKFDKALVTGATKTLSAYLRLIPGVNALRRAFDKTHASQKKFNSEMKKTSKNTNVASMSLGKFVLQTMKALIGVRSLYMLMRKLRTAVGEGFKSMAVQLEDVNAQLSSIVSSFNYMKASITAVVQPILVALAPALERLADAFERVTYYASSFIATLTGQDFVYRAIRVETDYAESLDKTAKSAKNAAKELGKYDKLNVIKKDNEDDKTGGMQWEKVPLDDTIKDWADKFKEFFSKLFDPLITAWNKFKTFFLNSWKYALDELLKLGQSVAKDFWAVWESNTVQKIFDNIIQALSWIGIAVGNIIKNIREAWEHNKNGLKILISIAKSVEIITEDIRQAAEYTAKWADELTFIPLFDQLADTFQGKIIPAVERVSELFKILYEQIILKIVKYFIEKGLPQLVDMAGKVVEIIGLISEKLRIGLQSGSNGILIVDRVEQLLQIVVDKIQECLDKTKEWADNLDFRPLLSSTKQFLEDIQPLIQFIVDTFGKFYQDVLLPFYEYLIEKGFPKLLDTVGQMVQEADWDTITENMNNFMDALEPIFELAWEVLIQLVKDFGTAVTDFLGSEEFKNIIDKIKEFSDNFKNMTDEERQQYVEDMAGKIESIVGKIIALTAALNLFAKVIIPLVTTYMTIVNFSKQGTTAKKIDDLTKKVAILSGESTGAGATGLAGLAAKLSGAKSELETFGAVMKNWGSVFTTPSELLTQLINLLGPGAGLVGAVTAAAGASTALVGGIDMMNNGFSLGSEALTIFGGALTAVGLIIAGVAAWPAVLAGAVVVWIANLGAFGDDLYEWVTVTAEDIRKKIGDFFGNLGHNFGVWVGQLLRKIVEYLKELPGKIKEWQESVDWAEFGLNILKGILAIFLLPGKLLTWIATAIGEFKTNFIKGLKEGFNMHSPSKVMEPYGEMILKGLLEGMLSVVKTIGTWIKGKVVDPILNVYKKYFSITALVNMAKQFMNGLKNGISTGVSTIISFLPSKVQNIIKQFTNKLKDNTLVSVGRNLLAGLKEGISDGLSNLLETIGNVCSDVIDTFKDWFNINSPSKVTEEFGKFLMYGLDKGVEEESDKDLIPTDFTDTFIDALTDMKVESLDIVTSMLDELSAKFEGYNMLSDFSSKVNSIKVPDIAIGSVLPANVAFKSTNTHTDENELKHAIQNAISEAFSSLDFNSNKEPIMLQLDKKMVAEAVWDETEKRYKQRGSYSQLYTR